MSNFNVNIDETSFKVTVLGDGSQVLLVSQGLQGPAGTTDHGQLSGLGDDDHTQYHNNARALTWLNTRSTNDLPEGGNLYYTNERVDDRVNALLQAGSNVTLTYDDNLNTLTIASTGGGGSPDWGDIGGTLSDQTDLQSALDAKTDESITITAGVGLTGGGDLSANRTINLDITELTAETTIADGDLIAIYDDSAGAHRKMTKANFVLGLGGGSLPVQTLTDGASVDWDLDDGHGSWTIGGNRTLNNPTNLTAGQTYILKVIQDGTGGRTITWSSTYKWTDGIDPVLSSAASAVDIFYFWSDGTNMYGTPVGFNFG